MKRAIKTDRAQIRIPVVLSGDEYRVEFFSEAGEKLYEFLIPAAEGGNRKVYPADYVVSLPAGSKRDREVIIVTEAPEAFADDVEAETAAVSDEEKKPQCSRPCLHFTPAHGWMNDPNGLVYADGIYHLYFQYNPFHVKWNNMTWGHAVSRDLLHWEEKQPVLYGDEYGTVFSGSAIRNEKGLLSLDREALVCFYTAAGNQLDWNRGKAFTQRLAWSTDRGMTFEKYPEAVIDTVCRENRDPKVFWHEESQAYICVLWLEENDFGIFRSLDLLHWEQSDRMTLKDAWECPDLVQLHDRDGNPIWMFTAADGYYFWGSFDGYHFQTDGVRHEAYSCNVPYAAQTYSGLSDRTVLIPWLRLPNDGRSFTGCMGIPMELTALRSGQGPLDYRLYLWPVREFWAELERAESSQTVSVMDLRKDEQGSCWQSGSGFTVRLKEAEIFFDPAAGILSAGEYRFTVGKDVSRLTLIADERLLEVFADGGRSYGACWI